MILTQAYFEDIKSELCLELDNAKETIYIALAWFTDKELLNLLIKKAALGISIQLLIYNDEINFGDYGLPFVNLKNAGGEVYTAKENLMHNKFCIIDECIIITGSYNWTKKANNENNENIVIIKGDIELAKSYIAEFKKLTGRNENFFEEQISKVIKRLQLIQKLIELHDVDDIDLQIARLQKDDIHAKSNTIIGALQNKQFANAIELINAFVKQYSSISIYIDPEIAALQLEISLLEYELVALDNEIAGIEKQIADFNHQLHERLGLLMDQVYVEKLFYFFCNRKENEETEQQYQEAKTKYEEFTKENIAEGQKHFFEITEQESKEIKKAYKAASLLCHPDKFENATDEIKQKAEEIFKELNAANERNDVKTVNQLYKQLQAGLLNVEISKQDNKQLLLLQSETLNEKCKAKATRLKDYKNSEVLKLIKQFNNWGDYFTEKEKQLKEELVYWQNKNSITINK